MTDEKLFEIRCPTPNCNRFLCKISPDAIIEIKCPSCKETIEVRPEPKARVKRAKITQETV